MADKTVTVKSSGGDYTSLNAALAGESIDLVTNTRILTIECYSMSDTTAASTGTGYTTSASYYINIVVPTSERHDGKWNTSKYRLDISTASTALNITASYTRATGLQARVTETSSNFLAGINLGNPSTSVRISYCYFGYTGNRVFACLQPSEDYSSGLVVWNCIAWNQSTYAHENNVCFGTGNASTSTMTWTFYNCTAYGGYYGFGYAGVTGKTLQLINCLATNTVSADFYNGASWGTSNYNAAQDASATGGANDRVSQTFTFVDSANGDFHLASTDAGARDYGVSDPGAGLFSDDIDGQTRTGTWDIGADEYVAAGGTPARRKFLFINSKLLLPMAFLGVLIRNPSVSKREMLDIFRYKGREK